MDIEKEKKEIDNFFKTYTSEELKDKYEKYNLLSRYHEPFSLYDVICSNLLLLWWAWCKFWGVLGFIFGCIKLWNYYI